MKKFILQFFLISIFILLFFCCENPKNKNENAKSFTDTNKLSLLKIYMSVNHFYNYEKVKKYIILNNDGCEGCVSFAINNIVKEFKNYGDSVNVIAVFNSKIYPLNISQLKTYYNNILIDSLNSFNKYNIAPYQSVVIIKKKNELEITDVMDYFRK